MAQELVSVIHTEGVRMVAEHWQPGARNVLVGGWGGGTLNQQAAGAKRRQSIWRSLRRWGLRDGLLPSIRNQTGRMLGRQLGSPTGGKGGG